MDALEAVAIDSSSGWQRAFDFPKWIHVFAWGGVFALGLLVLGGSRGYNGRNVWRDWTEAKELRQPVYAERIYPDDLLRTRANAWSNLAYVAVGLYALHDRLRRGCHFAFRRLVLSTAALVAARICWQPDVAKKFSGPDTLRQGHAVWHLLTALSLASMYLFCRTESLHP